MTQSTLRGHIDVADPETRIGVICDPYGVRYRFGKNDIAVQTPLVVGQAVSFTTAGDGRAQDIRPTAEATGGLDMGRIVRQSFSLLRQHWMPGLGAAVVLVGLPTAVSAAGAAEMPGALSKRMLWGGSVAGQVGHYLLMGLMALVAIDTLRERKSPFSETLRTSAKMALPIVGLGVLTTLGVFAAYFLLIVPGVILSLSWSVACPILMIEHQSIIGSLGRSRDLTVGHRWAIFGLFVVYGALWWVARFTLKSVCEALFGQSPSVHVGCEIVIAVVADLILALGVSSLYFELRNLKEGDEPDELAAIFD